MNININNYLIENSKQNGKPQKSGQIKSLNIGNLTANNTKTAIDKKRRTCKKTGHEDNRGCLESG